MSENTQRTPELTSIQSVSLVYLVKGKFTSNLSEFYVGEETNMIFYLLSPFCMDQKSFNFMP